MKALTSAEHLTAACAPGAEERRRGQAGLLRVLHVINRLDTGGTEYGVLKVMDGLGSELFEHRLCATRGFDPELARSRGLDGQLLAVGRPGANLQFLLFRLMRVMRAWRPHIVHSRNWGAIEAIPAARLAGVPVAIHSEHGYELDMLPGMPRRRRLLRRVAYSMADAVFTVSRDLRSYHARQAGVPEERIRVIYNGVDTRRYSPRPELRADLRRQFDLPAGAFVIGSVGRLVPLKDHTTLFKAAEALASRGIDVHVLLAGSGPELVRLQQCVDSLAGLAGRVHFLGVTDEVSRVLNAMDVFVLPSLCEGMSNTILEAMASGLPVVATRTGGNPELIAEGVTGCLFAPSDIADLTRRLELLAGDLELRRWLGASARQQVVERFGLDGMVADYRNLYLDLAARRGISVSRAA